MKATKTRFKQLPRVKQVLPSQCLSCDSEIGYTPRETTQDIEFRGELFPITYTHLACPECGEAILSDEQIVAQLKSLVAAYQQKHGLLTAEEMIQRRQALGFKSQRQLLDAAPEIKPATLKRLEAGQRVQDASTDLAFRSVLQHLEIVKRKQRMQALKLSEPTVMRTETSNIIHHSHWDAGHLLKVASLTVACVLPLAAQNKHTRKQTTSKSPTVVNYSSC
ncbi:hypothetical protein SH580_04930 [Coraliomargarita algicola]|uniref:HTH cro/C1-type domain-containing protein n=1 Tax=Coraliomargarita algicola TaxID=3092156 RepID=A0ABZ0RPI0_9BACT|nr:hypothetical protein [Coraliomargarita sp. J2-16]WPJ97048.1 hypothetical protein SH580_04930 [Coraliomargarita sp. J2-16]